jgi:hypothetical protein
MLCCVRTDIISIFTFSKDHRLDIRSLDRLGLLSAFITVCMQSLFGRSKDPSFTVKSWNQRRPSFCRHPCILFFYNLACGFLITGKQRRQMKPGYESYYESEIAR